MPIPKRLTAKDLEFLRLVYRQRELIFDPYTTFDWSPHTASRMRAAGLVRCDLTINRGTMASPGHWYNVYSYDAEYISRSADPHFLSLVKMEMPFYGEPYPEPTLSAPRRGHLRLVDEGFDPSQVPPAAI